MIPITPPEATSTSSLKPRLWLIALVRVQDERYRLLICRASPLGEWSWDVEWLLEEAASRAAQTSWARMGTDGPRRHARSFSSGTGAGWASRSCAPTMARHRWRHSQYVGLTRVQLEHSRRRASPTGGSGQHQRQAREQAERRSEELGSEDGAGALLPTTRGVRRW